VQYLGWLNAVPKLKVDPKSEKSRQELFDEQGKEIEYPPCAMWYMVDYLFSIGPVMSATSGDSPISHQEINAWQKNLQIKLCPWEAQTLRDMSRHYLLKMIKSDHQDSPPPWIPEIDQQQGERVAAKVKDILRG